MAHDNLGFTVIGWLTAKAAEGCAHSRTLSRGRRIVSTGKVARLRTTGGLPVGATGLAPANERFIGKILALGMVPAHNQCNQTN